VAELEQALGDYCVNQFGMTQETSYVFSVQRQPLVGFISLTAESAERHGRIDVREVSLRRIAPEPYMIQQGRAIRLVVLADFFAGEEGPGDPLAIGIGEGVDVDEAMARLLPAVHCDVLNYVDRLLRSVPELSALLELRRAVDSWAKANASSVQVAEAAAGDSLAPGWQNRADALTSAGKQHAGPFIAEIDRTLGNQCEAILSHPQFKALQSAWMGLDYLTRQIDFSTLSQIDVFSCPRETMVDTFRRGVVEPEVHHREGLPPALVVVDAEFSATDAAKVQELAQLAAAAEIPLVLGGFTDGHSPPRPLIRPDGAAPFVATVPTRIRLREALPNRSPRRFAYSPGRLAPETAVWASGRGGAIHRQSRLVRSGCGPAGHRPATVQGRRSPPPGTDPRVDHAERDIGVEHQIRRTLPALHGPPVWGHVRGRIQPAARSRSDPAHHLPALPPAGPPY
jgi:hypothetical protein